MGVEPTIQPARDRIGSFEDCEDHRTPCASAAMIDEGKEAFNVRRSRAAVSEVLRIRREKVQGSVLVLATTPTVRKRRAFSGAQFPRAGPERLRDAAKEVVPVTRMKLPVAESFQLVSAGPGRKRLTHKASNSCALLRGACLLRWRYRRR